MYIHTYTYASRAQDGVLAVFAAAAALLLLPTVLADRIIPYYTLTCYTILWYNIT